MLPQGAAQVHGILMCIPLQKEAKNNVVMPQSLIVCNVPLFPDTMSTIGPCSVTELFGGFLVTNKHQNLKKT